MKNAAKTRYKDKFQEFVSVERRRRLYERESLAFDATELISRLMEEKKITKAELARRIGKTRGYVTQLLSGSRNMTVYTLADLALALDSRIELKPRPCSRNSLEIDRVVSPNEARLRPRPVAASLKPENPRHVARR